MAARVLAVLLGSMFLAACQSIVVKEYGSEGNLIKETKTPKDVYVMEQQNAGDDEDKAKLFGALDQCDSGDPDTTAAEYNGCRMGNLATLLLIDRMHEDNDRFYWQDRASKRQFWLGVGSLVLNNPFTQLAAHKLLGSPGGSNDIRQEIHVNDRTSVAARDDSDANLDNAIPNSGGDTCIGCIGTGQGLDRSFVGFDAKIGTTWTEGGALYDGRNSGNNFQGDQNAPFDSDGGDPVFDPL